MKHVWGKDIFGPRKVNVFIPNVMGVGVEDYIGIKI